MPRALVKAVGIQWPRNEENLNELDDTIGRKTGVYLLYHGAMPVYIGRGILFKRLSAHDKERSNKTSYWDRFSWFVLEDPSKEKELEGLLLQALPFYIRVLNKQSARFPKKIRFPHRDSELPYIPLPKLPPLKKSK